MILYHGQIKTTILIAADFYLNNELKIQKTDFDILGFYLFIYLLNSN